MAHDTIEYDIDRYSMIKHNTLLNTIQHNIIKHKINMDIHINCLHIHIYIFIYTYKYIHTYIYIDTKTY